jgi:hypothetical protein
VGNGKEEGSVFHENVLRQIVIAVTSLLMLSLHLCKSHLHGHIRSKLLTKVKQAFLPKKTTTMMSVPRGELVMKRQIQQSRFSP